MSSDARSAGANGPSIIFPRDRLVRWLSEKGSGTWAEFRDAHEWVSDPNTKRKAWWAARDLQDLGYVEFAWDDDKAWSVAPPCLLMLPQSGGLAYLCGSRTKALVEAVAENPDCYPFAAPQHSHQGPHGLFLAVDDYDSGAALAKSLGIGFEFALAERLADCLPSLQALLALATEKPLPLGFELEYFDSSRLEWEPVGETTDNAATHCGFYRASTHGGFSFRLVQPGGKTVECLPQAGIYEVLRWENKGVIQHDAYSDRLKVLRVAGLPPLHAKTATLSSGLLPTLSAIRSEQTHVDHFYHCYENVSAEVAAAIMKSLSQEA